MMEIIYSPTKSCYKNYKMLFHRIEGLIKKKEKKSI